MVTVTLYDVDRKDKDDDVGVFETDIVPIVGDRITLMYQRGQEHYRLIDRRFGVAMQWGAGRLTTAELYIEKCTESGERLP